MSLDNKLSVKRSYSALEPKIAKDKHQDIIDKITSFMGSEGTKSAYKAMFNNKKKLSRTLRLLSSAGIPGKDGPGPSILENPDNFDNADAFANACVARHSRILKHWAKRNRIGFHINREATPVDWMNDLERYFEYLAMGPNALIAALSVYDSGVRSAVEAKPQENIKTKEEAAAEKALAEEKSIFMKGRHSLLSGKLGMLKSRFIDTLKTYNGAKRDDYKIGKTLIFFIDQDSSLSSDPFNLDATPKSTPVKSQVRRLAVLAQNSNGNIVIMAENDERSDVTLPEPYNQSTLKDINSITYKVLRTGNPEYQAQQAAAKAETDARVNMDKALLKFGKQINLTDVSILKGIAEAFAEHIGQPVDQAIQKYEIVAIIDHFTQSIGGIQTDPTDYFQTNTYIVRDIKAKSLIWSVVDRQKQGSDFVVSGPKAASKLSRFVQAEGLYVFVNNQGKASGIGGQVMQGKKKVVLPMSVISKKGLKIIK